MDVLTSFFDVMDSMGPGFLAPVVLVFFFVQLSFCAKTDCERVIRNLPLGFVLLAAGAAYVFYCASGFGEYFLYLFCACGAWGGAIGWAGAWLIWWLTYRPPKEEHHEK